MLPSALLRSTGTRTEQRPNVLFIIVDDLRPDLGCYGSVFAKTPNIDRLAARGLVFSRAYCQQSICNPSRASMLTGLRPDTLQVWNNETSFRKINPSVPTLPQMFAENGYESIRIGKIYHNTLPDPVSWNRPEPRIPVKNIYKSPEIRDRQRFRQAAARRIGRNQWWIDSYIRGPATECCDVLDSNLWDGAAADAAITTMWQYRNPGPFFLAVGFMKPHLPYVAPKRYWDLYKREEIPLAANPFLPKGAPRFAMNYLSELASYEDFVHAPNPAEGQLREEEARLLRHGYYACVSFIDAQIGKLMKALDHMGLREKTIVVLASDHGIKLGEHGSWGKFTNYETDIRAPLIISAPGWKTQGKTTRALVEYVDIYPTLCEMADLKPPENLEGISMVPLLRDPAKPWKTAAFSQAARGFYFRFMGNSIRTDRHHYIEWRERLDKHLVAVELYDHETDPLENVNIAAVPDNQGLVKSLASQLARGWQEAKPR